MVNKYPEIGICGHDPQTSFGAPAFELSQPDKPSAPPVMEIQGWKSSFGSSRLCFWDRTGTNTHIGESGLQTLTVSSAQQEYTPPAPKFYNGGKMELIGCFIVNIIARFLIMRTLEVIFDSH